MNIPTTLMCLGSLVLAAACPAQSDAAKPKKKFAKLAAAPANQTQEGLIALRTTKLSEPWVTNAAWITDYDEALATAQREKKKVFGYFSRSYAP